MRNRMFLAGVVSLIALPLIVAQPAQGASLDKALLDQGASLLKGLHERKVKTVGVLPFRVKRGARNASFSAAPLATNLPGRLENALVLRQSANTLEPIRIIRDASSTATKARVGSWMTKKAAFDKLFSTKYPLVWGNESLAPDAFLTGEIVSNPVKNEATVTVQLITPASWKAGKVVPTTLKSFKCKADRDLVRDLGYAFSLPPTKVASRALKRDDLERQTQQQIRNEEQGKIKDADLNRNVGETSVSLGGLKLEILYDDVAQTIKQAVAGEGANQPLLEVPPPQQGQKVVLVITRLNREGGKIGAVLKVNGQSTYNNETLGAEGCLRWVYSPERTGKPDKYTGFYEQVDGELKAKEFEVLSAEESKLIASELGGRAGWIDLDVFISEEEAPKGGGDDPPPPPPPAEDELVISTRGGLKVSRYKTLGEAQKAIAKANNLKVVPPPFVARGLIGTTTFGAEEPQPYKSTNLPNPRHIGGVSIRYYTPPTDTDGDKLTD